MKENARKSLFDYWSHTTWHSRDEPSGVENSTSEESNGGE